MLPETDGTAEARAAARWWAERLTEKSGPDTGDDGADAVMSVASAYAERPSDEQVDTFREALERLVLERIVGHGSWRNAILRGDQGWGSFFRTVATEWTPDETLGDALEVPGRDGSSMGLLPPKTVMWVSPGKVSAALGYSQVIEVPHVDPSRCGLLDGLTADSIEAGTYDKPAPESTYDRDSARMDP